MRGGHAMPHASSRLAAMPPRPAAGLADVMIRTGQGDVSAFEQLYAMTVDAVTTLARSVVINPEQADEVVQEVYLELWGYADRFDPTRGAALTWLLHIARCRSIDRVRHSEVTRAREHAYFQGSGRATPDDSVLDEVLRAETSRELRSAVGDLSERQRQMV